MSGPSHLKRQQGSAAVAVVSVCRVQTGKFWRASFRFSRKAMRFSLGSWVIVETGHSPTTNSIFMGGLPMWVFWSLSYPVLLQPESWEFLGQGADPQAGWGVTASWRLNPPDRSRQVGLLGLLDWWIPEQVEAWQLSGDRIPRQVKAGRPPGSPRLELGIPSVSSVTSAG